jgi:hypothetical protein
MLSLTSRLEKWFSAIAFAEEGEHATAMEMIGRVPAKEVRTGAFFGSLEKAFAAAAFAEADCPETALEMLDEKKRSRFLETLGLAGVKVWQARVPFLENESFLDTVGLSGVRVKLCVVSF